MYRDRGRSKELQDWVLTFAGSTMLLSIATLFFVLAYKAWVLFR